MRTRCSARPPAARPAATAAATRLRVPSVRMRSLPAACSSILRGSRFGGRSVSSCRTTSGCAASIAARTPSASNTSQTTGVAPASRSASARASLRVIAVTCGRRDEQCGSSRRPITPVAPARNTLTPAACPAHAVAHGAPRLDSPRGRPPASGRRTPPVSNSRLDEVERPCQPGSVPPMSNRWLTVCSALWTNAAKSMGTRHDGRPTAASRAMPTPAWNVAMSRRKWWSAGPKSERWCRRTSPGRSQATRRSRAGSGRGSPRAMPHVALGQTRSRQHRAPSAVVRDAAFSRIGRSRHCDRCHTWAACRGRAQACVTHAATSGSYRTRAAPRSRCASAPAPTRRSRAIRGCRWWSAPDTSRARPEHEEES